MKIMAAYKPSNEGSAVLDFAIDEAQRRQAELLIVRHVNRSRDLLVEAGRAGTLSPPAPSGGDIEKLREELETLRQQVELRGITCEVLLLDDGDAAEEILATAESAHVGLIVIGVRRRSRVGKAILGSESQDIILNANCPVLAVKADAETE